MATNPNPKERNEGLDQAGMDPRADASNASESPSAAVDLTETAADSARDDSTVGFNPEAIDAALDGLSAGAEAFAADSQRGASAADDSVEESVQSKTQPEARASQGAVPTTAHAVPLPLPDFAAPAEGTKTEGSIDLLDDVELHVTIELGRSRMNVEEVLKLGPGSVVGLDKLAGDPVDVLVNERLVARGEVLVLNDTFSVRINEIITNLEELDSGSPEFHGA